MTDSPRSASLQYPRQRINDLLRERNDPDVMQKEPAAWRTLVNESLAEMHRADIADLLESLPPEDRADVWAAIPEHLIDKVLPEVGDQLCEQLIELTPTELIISALRRMDVDEVASLMRELPKNNAARLMRLAGLVDDPDLRASLSFDNDTVGAQMDFQPVLVREDETVEVIRERLQKLKELPSHCDKLFVVDDWERLAGVLPLKRLLLNAPQVPARDIMVADNLHTFHPDDDVNTAAGAFERYDLISAPVLDTKHKIVGRITIDEILDYLQQGRGRNLLNSAGVSEEEDLFASVAHRFSNRWRWLFINLLAAFLISRVVGLFETTIAQLVALATLMPIVAGMSGNIGNQTATLTVRALALNQINTDNWKKIIHNEAVLSIVNGIVWGGLVAVFAYLLYERLDLSLVLVGSMTLCFLCGATAGFSVPIIMQRMGRDPALGTTVVISVLVDILGFLIFLGMAALLLV